MGTSKSLKTPGGGAWTEPKSQLTDHISDRKPLDAPRFVRRALKALGGIGMKPRISSGGDVPRSISSSSGGGRGGSGGGGSYAGGALGGAIQGLGGFGAQVASGGLDAG